MSGLSAFEPVWEDMRQTRAHLADMLGAMRSAGLIEKTPERCSHPNAIPVALTLTGEVVAALCPDCDQQLPASYARNAQVALP